MDFNYTQIGNFLIAVGIIMVRHNVCAAEAVSGRYDEALVGELMKRGMDGAVATGMLDRLDLGAAVEIIN